MTGDPIFGWGEFLGVVHFEILYNQSKRIAGSNLKKKKKEWFNNSLGLLLNHRGSTINLRFQSIHRVSINKRIPMGIAKEDKFQ